MDGLQIAGLVTLLGLIFGLNLLVGRANGQGKGASTLVFLGAVIFTGVVYVLVYVLAGVIAGELP